MNPRTFLQQFEESSERDWLVDETFLVFKAFARSEGIPSNELSDDVLAELAEAYVERGLGVRKTTTSWDDVR